MSIVLEKTLAASPNTERGRPTQLSSDPKGERIAYASGKSIFLRNLDDPSLSIQYTPHTVQTTVARFSPSGYYIASGDVAGNVKVWDAVEGVNTKGDYHIISGRINDLAWDGDSQRVIAVGDGRERFGHCITADSGNSVGEISGHSKVINSVSIRQQRPLRAATGSDDSSLVFLHGAPFKYDNKVGGLHKGYLYGVGFSPDGNHLVSVGADRRIQLYDGKTGAATVEIGEGEHKGSIFAVSWAKDSKRFVTASADQTVKLWDVEAGKAVQTWKFGGDNVSVPDHQVGVVWPGRSDGLVVSLNLDGDLTYLVEGSQKPTKLVQGHNKSITAMGSTGTGKDQTFWTGSFDGRICSWNSNTGLGSVVEGSTHSNQVMCFTTAGDRAFSAGWDDTLRTTDAGTNSFIGEAVKLTAQPKGVTTSDGRVFVAQAKGVDVISKDELVYTLNTPDFTPMSVAAYGSLVAVGTDQNKIEVYKVGSDHKLSFEKTIPNAVAGMLITAMSFSPDGSLIAVGNSQGKIAVYDSKTWDVKTDRWSAHTARVMNIAWNSAGTHAASVGLDTNIYLWSLKSPGKRVKALNAHKDGIYGVCWLDNDQKIATAGGDAALKIWDVLNLHLQ